MKIRKGRIVALFAGLLALMALFSDFLSSNSPSAQNLDQFFQPPSPIHMSDGTARERGGLFIYRMDLTDPLDVSYQERRLQSYPLEVFFEGYSYKLFGCITTNRHLLGRSRPPFFYPMGTDDLGRDVLARVLAGTRTSMLVVILGLILYAALGITVGAFAGLFGGWIDSILMRLSEFMMALPALYLIMAMRAGLPAGVPFIQNLLLIVSIIALVSWPPMARGIRGLIVQIKASGHVEAARAMGGSPVHIFRRHMVPFLIPFTLSQLTVAAPIFLLGEVVLSFLNIGFRDSGESWGSMLRGLRDVRILTDFWWNLLPLCMVFLTLLFLNLFSSNPAGKRRDEHSIRL